MSEIKISKMNEKELADLSKKMLLSLNESEMLQIQKYYKKIGREPTHIELETIAQTWSEHCKHKTFNALINYKENGKQEKIDSLFKTYIREPTYKSGKKWLVSVFSDNAGIIQFNENYDIAMKVETHNHPSALDPFGGANTGVGGVIRDVLGAGLGARPFACTDVLCFGNHDTEPQKIPKGVLHPKRIFKGVRAGIMDYGNKLGIPTVNGAILFEPRYIGNPLVYCGTIGILPKEMAQKKASPGELIVVIGGRTGRDGLHGATFSSTELTPEISSSVVQIGNPIEEKKMIEAILKARDLKLYTAITDCGAGGFSSAIGEMGSKTGAKVYLEKAPLKYEGLQAWEIWLSEAQERMILAVPKNNFQKIKEICEIEGTEATIIGEFTDTKKLEIYYNKELVGELDMDFLHNGNPKKELEAEWIEKKEKTTQPKEPKDYGEILKKLLSMPNISSKEKTVRKYDHEVRGGTVLKPFVGPESDAPSDAAIVRPLLDSWKGVVIANGINPFYTDMDPYWMACSAIDEAIRNAICVGADFEKIALLDNFSWGNPEKKETLGELVRACKGCHDAAIEFNTPFISGKDSLYNEYNANGKKISIPGTLLISAIGIIEDSRKKISMPFKKEGNSIYIIGETYCELGGSHYFKLTGTNAGEVPKVRFGQAKKAYSMLSKLISSQNTNEKIVTACHDCSEGGIAIALAEMAFGSGLGAEIDCKKIIAEEKIQRPDILLFSESNSRIIVEVAKGKEKDFEKALEGTKFSKIGEVKKQKKLIMNFKEKKLIEESLAELKNAWKKTLWW
jgi:phosphoribosylformylglycinamidine synthase